jgi:hypothetical protein
VAALLVVLAGLISRAHADPGNTTADCREAGLAAERAAHLPPGLLHAIGIVESGRPDPQTGRLAAWPWTINAEGVGRAFATRTEAIAATRALQERGIVSIDIGCFQVNLFYHPAAFASLQEAFDPAANAVYAARFLSSLRATTGSWQSAVAAYHSADPERGGAYGERIWTIFRQSDQGDTVQAQRTERVLVWAGAHVATTIPVWTPSGPGLAPSVIVMRLPADEPHNRLPLVSQGVFAGSGIPRARDLHHSGG